MLHDQSSQARRILGQGGLIASAAEDLHALPDRDRPREQALSGGAADRGEERVTTILIADVDKNLGIVLKQELEDEGFTVQLAREGGAPGADLSRYPAYDVVILGMLVPSLDVFNRLKLLKRINAEAEIIFFSEQLSPAEASPLIDAGADRCFARHEINGLKTHLSRSYQGGAGPAGTVGVP